MPFHQPIQPQRPMLAYLVTTLAASVATLITVFCSTTGHAAGVVGPPRHQFPVI
jgi:hypothetical protein